MARSLPIDPLRPYGPLLESRLRLVTWNVWGRYGPWREREAAITATLAAAQPDVVVRIWHANRDARRMHRSKESPAPLPWHTKMGL